tara:strand:+ start:417 stop:746 length:330 start_codon:yes stop_codon:yes gene_type:complete
MDTILSPTTIALSLPADQLELLHILKEQNDRLIELKNRTVYLTEPEAAERLKVSLTTIRQWRKEGWLRFFAEGANIRYRTDYLDEDFENRAIVKSTFTPFISNSKRKTA